MNNSTSNENSCEKNDCNSKNTTLVKMLLFNAGEPIKQEIIFEDSDDEETLQLESNLKKELSDTDTFHTENILKIGSIKPLSNCNVADDNNNSSLTQFEKETTDKIDSNQTSSISFETLDEIISNAWESNENEINLLKRKLSENCANSNEPKRRFCDNIENTVLVNPTTTDLHLVSAHQEILTSNDDPTTNITTHTNNGVIDSNMPLKDYSLRNDLHLVQTHQEILTSNDPTTNVTTDTNNDSNMPIKDYSLRNALLKSVIKNVILILPSLNDYVNSEFEPIKKKVFCKVKSYYFCLSYTAVASVILPLKYNNAFMEKFLSRIAMCASSNAIVVSRHNLKVLCDELILFTENKNREMSFHLKKVSLLEQDQLLSHPKKNKEQNINILNKSEILSAQSNIRIPISNVANQRIRIPPQNPEIRKELVINNSTNHINTATCNNYNCLDNITVNSSTVNNADTQYTPKDLYSTSYVQTKPFHEVIQSNQQRIFSSTSTSKLQKQNNQSLPSNSITTAHNVRNNLNTNFTYRQTVHNFPNMNLQTPEVHIQERSISRDSGYLSPELNQMTTSARRPAPGTTFDKTLPVIVDVTSANRISAPRNSASGYCQTCHAYTNLMCLGCKLVFYCSAPCQARHWKVHQNFCYTLNDNS